MPSLVAVACFLPDRAKDSSALPHMYRQFNIQQFYVLHTQCIYVFCVDLRTNSDFFPMKHKHVVFSTETQYVFCEVGTKFLRRCIPENRNLHHRHKL